MSRTLTPFQAIVFSDFVGILSMVGVAFVATLTYFVYAIDGFVLDVIPVGVGMAVFMVYFGIHYLRRSHRIMARIQNKPIRRATVSLRAILMVLFVFTGFTAGTTYMAYLLSTRGYATTASIETWAIAFTMASVAGTALFLLVERDILGRLARTQAKLAAGAKP